MATIQRMPLGRVIAFGLLCLFALSVRPARAQAPLGDAFTYQGRLAQAGVALDGPCDIQFVLYDAENGGVIIAPGLIYYGATAIDVIDGVFTVELDFNATNLFDGAERWLQIGVRFPSSPTPPGPGSFTPLTPRQRLTAAPHASFALKAPWSGLSGVPAGFADGIDNAAAFTLPFSATASMNGSLLMVHNTYAAAGRPVAIHGVINPGVYNLDTPAAILGENLDTSGVGAGVRGESASGPGVSGVSDTGVGVEGIAAGANGKGVVGSGATGVQGYSPSPTGKAVEGLLTTSNGVSYAGYFSNFSSQGYGLYAVSNYIGAFGLSGSSIGVSGQSTTGVGVQGLRTSASGTSPAIYGESASNSHTAPAIHGRATGASGNTRGVFGESLSTNGTGVYGSCVDGFGLYGISTNGTAVVAYGSTDKALHAFADSGQAGLFEVRHPSSSSNALEVTTVGDSSSQAISATHTGLGDCGLFQITNAASGAEVLEARTNGSGDAVQAINSGTGRAGYFQNSSALNGTYALYARTDGNGVAAEALHSQSGNLGFLASPDFGAYGYNGVSENVGFLGGQAYAVYGINIESPSPNWGYIGGVTRAVYGDDGINTWGYLGGEDHGAVGVTDGGGLGEAGVYGEGVTDTEFGVVYGVYGKAVAPIADNAFGVYCNGEFAASGSKSFQIDHPLDPENKFLNHFCAEGPEATNVYTGNATLDDSGSAWVELPEYFEEINIDPRYQLTAVGAPGPNLHVARKIEGRRFQIAGGSSDLEVSWTVTAVRNDRYLRAHRRPAEQAKPSALQGRYVQPELYGQPPEKAIVQSPQRSAATTAGSSH